MKRRLFIKGLFFFPWCGAALPADPLAAMQETPMFVDEVKAGRLPPVARRVPEQPLVVRTFAGNDGPGRQGGQLTMLVTGTRDTVLMTIYSYARLIVYDQGWPQMVGRPSLYGRGLPLLLGRHRQRQRPLAVWSCG